MIFCHFSSFANARWAVVLVIMFILIIWIWRKAGKGPGEI